MFKLRTLSLVLIKLIHGSILLLLNELYE